MKHLMWILPVLVGLLLAGCDGFGLYGKVSDEELFGDHLNARLVISDKGPENDAKYIMYEAFNLARKWPEAERLTLQIVIVSKRKVELDFGRHRWDNLAEMRELENKLVYVDKNKAKLRSLQNKLKQFLSK